MMHMIVEILVHAHAHHALDACTAMGACAAIRWLAFNAAEPTSLLLTFRYQSHFFTLTGGQRFAGKNDFAGFRPANQPGKIQVPPDSGRYRER